MKKKQQQQSKINESVDESNPLDFSTAITRVTVAQICQSVGFRAAQRSALESLTDVAARYLRSLAKSAAASAVSTGRTQSNLLDVVRSLEEFHSPIGFRGNSNVCQSLFSSSILADIMRFVDYNREIPFAKPVPCRKYAPILPLQLRLGSGYGGNHIPEWLPAFPEMRSEEEVGNGEEKWGGIFGEKNVEREGKKRVLELDRESEEGKKREMEIELPKEREKVRFKMGKGVKKNGGGIGIERKEMVKNGVCKGNRIILKQNWNLSEEHFCV